MSRVSLTRTKIYNTIARQLHGVVPCWVCGCNQRRHAKTVPGA